MCLYFKVLPELIAEEEVNKYLARMASYPKFPLRSSFKHMVCGLPYYYRLLGISKLAIALLTLKVGTKLPIIPNRWELKELFYVAKLLKQCIVLMLVFS